MVLKLIIFLSLSFGSHQLYDKISCTVMSPTRAPPGDAVARCRDAIEAIISAPGHKYNCEKNELLQLLSQSHVQVSAREMSIANLLCCFFPRRRRRCYRHRVFIFVFFHAVTPTNILSPVNIVSVLRYFFTCSFCSECG